MVPKVESARAEALARRIARALHAYTGGRPGDWAMLRSIMRRLGPKDEATTDAAVALATAKGWIEDRGGSSIRLTDDGRLLAQG